MLDLNFKTLSSLQNRRYRVSDIRFKINSPAYQQELVIGNVNDKAMIISRQDSTLDSKRVQVEIQFGSYNIEMSGKITLRLLDTPKENKA